MNQIVMNVTPAEFSEIQMWSIEMSEPDFVAMMVSYYGCKRFGSYRLVVHRNAPMIPMMSYGLDRFEHPDGDR